MKIAEASISTDPTDRTTRKSALRVSKDTFDLGIYQLEVLLNGQRQKVVQFTVAAPSVAAPTPSPAATATPLRPRGTYVVKAGDSVIALAAAWGVSTAAIVELNSIENPSLILIGQTLKVPEPGQVVPTRTPTPGP